MLNNYSYVQMWRKIYAYIFALKILQYKILIKNYKFYKWD